MRVHISPPRLRTRAGAQPPAGPARRHSSKGRCHDPPVEETAINEKLQRFHALIRHEGADAPTLDQWGKRTLAFPIKNRETGHYVIAKFEALATALPEFERAIKLDDGVLRHLVVVNDGAQPVPVNAAKSEEEDDE